VLKKEKKTKNPNNSWLCSGNRMKGENRNEEKIYLFSLEKKGILRRSRKKL